MKQRDTMTLKRLCAIIVALLSLQGINAIGRQIYNFNADWRFMRGDIANAQAVDFDDSQWQTVSTPHSVKLMPAEASGCRNYQGVAWYRKQFVVPVAHGEIHFEAAMGNTQVYINGKEATTHYGGYTPFSVLLDDCGQIAVGDTCTIAVRVDNSDDKTTPPGKTQTTLDFTYHGGIYRDVWLISRGDTYITDPIRLNRVAGGGVFVHYSDISEKAANVFVDVTVANRQGRGNVTVEQILTDADGKQVGKASKKVLVADKEGQMLTQKMSVKKPHLWSPESPYLYTLTTNIRDGRGNIIDNEQRRIGIRSFEFKGKEGFWLNGKPYKKFIGGNRHQDFAYVGNALPNSQQWRDALRLKQLGFNLIRVAHYPQDPSFMDACDELGLFVIVATPGWQYWNKNTPVFEERVYQNTREIIRRDRNHPCVLMWEPILNETRFPEDFSLKSLQITREEYPYPYRPVAAADVGSAGVRDNYDVVYGWPGDERAENAPQQCILTREYGELVDDWYAQNNINRCSRSWGEVPMLQQALSLSKSTAELYATDPQFIGGCQWHPFDHQRGYHPDPYWGGDYDAFRQKKTAWMMFHAQIPRDTLSDEAASRGICGPYVGIAHEMTQFSPDDVTVFSNCDSVRLTSLDGYYTATLPVVFSDEQNKVNPQPLTFPNAWQFMAARQLSYKQKAWDKVRIVAEGIIDGRVVCRDEKMPARRSTRLRLYADTMDRPLVADGSDFIVVVCEVTDDNGNVRRLAKDNIRFTVSGEGELIGDNEGIAANPRQVEWGSAPALIRSTTTAGTIHVHAEETFPGVHAPLAADMDIMSVASNDNILPSAFRRTSVVTSTSSHAVTGQSTPGSDVDRAGMLEEVIQQQADFGISQ